MYNDFNDKWGDNMSSNFFKGFSVFVGIVFSILGFIVFIISKNFWMALSLWFSGSIYVIILLGIYCIIDRIDNIEYRIKNPNPEKTNSSSKEWICEYCGNENSGSKSICGMCKSVKN